MAKTIASDIPVISPSVAIQILKALVGAGPAAVPPFLWGPPGVGKSAIVRETCEEMGIGFIDLRLVQLDSVDLRGIPYVCDDPVNKGQKMMGFAAPSTLPREGQGIIFLDEFPQAPTLVQNAASELVLDRRIGDYKLPDGWIVVAAGNRREDRAATQELPSHLRNRFAHLQIEPRFDDWKGWAEKSKEAGGGEVEPRLVAFLDSNQGRLNAFDPDKVASPTSRTWEFVGRVIQIFDGHKDKRARNAMIGGCVGKGMQAEVTAFLADSEDMPTLDQICKDPANAPVPDSTSACRSVLDNMANTIPPKFAASAATYAARHVKETQMMCVVQIMGRKDYKEFTDPAYKAWETEILKG